MYSEDEKLRAKKVDLIFLPKELKERCSNCKYLSKEAFCNNKRVMLQIESPEDECCGLWDNSFVDRTRTQS